MLRQHVEKSSINHDKRLIFQQLAELPKSLQVPENRGDQGRLERSVSRIAGGCTAAVMLHPNLSLPRRRK
jgi:hypothetical protein